MLETSAASPPKNTCAIISKGCMVPSSLCQRKCKENKKEDSQPLLLQMASNFLKCMHSVYAPCEGGELSLGDMKFVIDCAQGQGTAVGRVVIVPEIARH